MVQFDCNQYARLEAHATLEVDVLEIASGRSVYSKSYTADKVDGSVVTLNAGIFGSVDALKKVANDTIQNVIDQIVTDSALLARLK